MVTCYSTRNQARYSSSLTFSSHSTYLPSSPSCMATCEIAVVEVAPCQCFSRGGHQTMSPARISTFRPALALHPTAALSDDEHLPEGSPVQSRSRARLKGDERA